MTTVEEIHKSQQQLFNSNVTKPVKFRVEQLVKLKQVLKANEQRLYDAIYADFAKSEFETFLTELSQIYHEIDILAKNIRKWARKKRVCTGLESFPARSYIIPEPLGTVLVIGAWNYPYQLSFIPALTALAAGNTVILKPSELPANTSRVMADIINSTFPSSYFHVVEGGIAETTLLLEQKFDKIFFTGSTPVGKVVYEAAAKNLTPVTLELGGKSPTFVLKECNIPMAAKRIVWAKLLNAGQTCVAPDYILAEEPIANELIRCLVGEMERYPQDELGSCPSYLKIVNHRNFDRLQALIDSATPCFGGKYNRDERFISPTLIANATWDDPAMRDEIFGPILPVITFTDLDDAIRRVKERPKPLACYIYSTDKRRVNKILNEISFGGGAVNESLMHLTNSNLPFGGVGSSGIGSYHGKAGFDAFTHYKSIMYKPFWFEPTLKYPPYTSTKAKLIRWFLG